jgi:hypothetical protein
MKAPLHEAYRVRKAAPRAGALPVAPAIGAAQMSDAADDPIWPYGDAETLAALTHIAELFDSTVVEEQPRPAASGDSVRLRREGIVVSARADADEVGSLYAHLTNRRFETARDYAVIETSRPDVVVAPQDVLTPDFLRRLYSDPEWSPGLITGSSPKDLLRQALLRAAAVSLCGRTKGKRVDVRPLAEFGRINLGEWEMLGRRAGPAQLRRALGSGSELLTIFTVGDGIDAVLGSLILCPMERKPALSKGASPPCVVSGTCHRLQLPMAEALASARFVPPEAIAARVLVLHACWGIQPAGSLHGPTWGYGHRLADHDRLGAMLTTWQITIGAQADTEPLARDLARGMSLGRALARFNHSASSRRTGQLMCLLGDPDMRISTRAWAPGGRRSPPHKGTPQNEHGQLAFLAAYFNTMVPKRESKALNVAARDAIAACQRRAWSGLAIDTPDEPSGAVMRQAVLAFLCQHGTIPAYHWMDLAYPVSMKDSGTWCLACGQSDRVASLRLRVLGAGSRKMQLCARCGLTEDRPAKMGRIGLTIEKDVACLHLSPPRGSWVAALLFRPHVGAPFFRPWPAADDHKPLSAMQIFGTGEPHGAGQLLLFMMEGASLWVARTQYGPGT